MAGTVVAFVVAAVLEIGGCFAFWSWLRRGGSPFSAGLGVLCLVGFAVALTRAGTAFAGRAYAAYGGLYIAASLVWLWAVEHQRPSRADLGGAALAVAGAVWILFAGRLPAR
jgi:small multidrug resistance family-3 protein